MDLQDGKGEDKSEVGDFSPAASVKGPVRRQRRQDASLPASTQSMSSKPEKKGKPAAETPSMLPAPYVLKGELGRGGMGVVYRAFDPPRNQDVAVKFLPDAGKDENQTQRRFQREAHELAAMSHPNIVAFYGAGRHEGRDYLIMELVEGGNLHEAMKSRGSKVPAVEAAHLFAQIAEGLAHIHDQGLVHRDFKPENVLLTTDGIPKITDFGLARRMEERSRLTSAGTIIGTYSYLAPEQIISSDVGPAADLYAFGCCLYEILAGRPIFSAETEFALLNSHLREVPVTLRSIDSSIAPELDALVLKLVKKTPEERPTSAAEVARILRAFVAKQVPSAPSGGEWSGTIGRQDNKAQLEELCLHVKETDSLGVSVLFTAPNGYGRSVVVREVVSNLRSKGVTVFTAVPQHGIQLPLREVYGALGGDVDAFARTLYYGGPRAAALVLRQALGRFPKPALIVADDVVRMGPTTGQIVQCLAGLQPPRGKGWLISCQSARASSFALWEGATKVDLPALAADKIAFLAEKELAAPIDKELQEWLVSRAAGSVRRLRLYLYALQSVPSIAHKQGSWGWLEGSPPPANYVEPILHGLTQGVDSDLKFLRAACLSDEPFPFDVAASAAGLSEDEADASIERLSRHGLLEEAWGGKGEHYYVASPEIKEAVVRGLADRTRKRLHSRLVEAMAPARGERAHAGARGRHQFEAQQGPDSLGNLIEGAGQLANWGAFSEAAELWQMAHQVVQGIELPELRWRVEVGAVESLWRGGRIEEALALAESLKSQTAPTSPEALEHFRNLQGIALRLAWLNGKSAQEMEAACRHCVPSVWQQLTYAQVLDALEKRPEALKVLDELGKSIKLPPAYYVTRGRLLRALGRYKDALTPLESALKDPEYLSLEELYTLRWEVAECRMALKELPTALETIDASLRECVADQERDWEARFWGQRGRCCELAEDWEEATASFEDGVKCASGNNARLAESLVALGHHQLMRRQLPKAEATLREVLTNTQAERYSVQASLGLGIACLLGGRLEEAHEWLNQAIGGGAEAAALLLQAEVARLQSNSAQVVDLLDRAVSYLRPDTLELGMAQTLKGLLGHPVDRGRVLEILIAGPSLTVGDCLRSVRTDWIERVRSMVPANLEPTRTPRPAAPSPVEEVPLQPTTRDTNVISPAAALLEEPLKPVRPEPVPAAVVKPEPAVLLKPVQEEEEAKPSILPKVLIGVGLMGMLAMGVGLVKNHFDQKTEPTVAQTTQPTAAPETPAPPVTLTPVASVTPVAPVTPEISATPASTPTPAITPTPETGTIRLQLAKAPAVIKIDGDTERADSKTFEKQIKPGPHNVTVSVQGFEPRTLSLNVEAGKTISPDPIKLVEATGSLEVVVKPANARLFVDGRTAPAPSEKGTYRLAELKPTQHTFKAVLDGYKTYESKKSTKVGTNSALRIDLEKIPEPVHVAPAPEHHVERLPDRPVQRPIERPQPPIHREPPPRPRPHHPIAAPDNI